MSISEQLIEVSNKIEALDDKINLIDGTVQFNLTLHWSIIIGVITIAGIALYFISKSIIQTGIEKGINKISDDNKLKLNKKNPEMIGTLKINNSDNDDVNVRFVKLKDEPIINVETDKNDAELTINHRRIITSSKYSEYIYATLMNGSQGRMVYSCLFEGDNIRLIELTLKEVDCHIDLRHMISRLPKDFYPTSDIIFEGIDKNYSIHKFSINQNGEVFAHSKSNEVKGSVIYIARKED